MYYTESRHDLSTQNPFFAQKYRKETAPAVSFVLLFFCILRHDAVVGIPRQLVHDGIQHREHRKAHRRCADQQPPVVQIEQDQQLVDEREREAQVHARQHQRQIEHRQQLAVALWTAAGKPATQSTALFNDVAADAAELQAIRWVVDTGLMSAQDGSFKPGSRVGRMEVIRTWKTYQQRG